MKKPKLYVVLSLLLSTLTFGAFAQTTTPPNIVPSPNCTNGTTSCFFYGFMMEDAEAVRNDLQPQIDTDESSIADLQAASSANAASLAAIQNSLNAIQNSLQNLQTSTTSSLTGLNNLVSQIQASEAADAQQLQQLTTSETTDSTNIAAMQPQILALQSQSASLNNQLTSLTTQLSTLSNSFTSLNNQVTQISQQLATPTPPMSGFNVTYDSTGKPTISWTTFDKGQTTVAYGVTKGSPTNSAQDSSLLYVTSHSISIPACPNGQGKCWAYPTDIMIWGYTLRYQPGVPY